MYLLLQAAYCKNVQIILHFNPEIQGLYFSQLMTPVTFCEIAYFYTV